MEEISLWSRQRYGNAQLGRFLIAHPELTLVATDPDTDSEGSTIGYSYTFEVSANLLVPYDDSRYADRNLKYPPSIPGCRDLRYKEALTEAEIADYETSVVPAFQAWLKRTVAFRDVESLEQRRKTATQLYMAEFIDTRRKFQESLQDELDKIIPS